MSDPHIDARIGRIKALLDQMAVINAEAREEILAATEQLLERARKNHELTVLSHRDVHKRVAHRRRQRASADGAGNAG